MSVETAKRISLTGADEYVLKTEIQQSATGAWAGEEESLMIEGAPSEISITRPGGQSVHVRIRYYDAIGSGSFSNILQVSFSSIGGGDLDDESKELLNYGKGKTFNPSFEEDTNEDGTPDGWTFYGTVVREARSDTISGKYVCKLTG